MHKQTPNKFANMRRRENDASGVALRLCLYLILVHIEKAKKNHAANLLCSVLAKIGSYV